MKFLLTIVTISLICCSSALAQKESFIYDVIKKKDGLPSNEVYFIFRDSKQYLWFATDEGVVRYNGVKMEEIPVPDKIVFKIYEDERGRIWFFCRSGIISYFKDNKIFNYLPKINQALIKADIIISNAMVSSKDSVYINTGRSKYILIDPKGGITIQKIVRNSEKATSRIEIKELENGKYFTQLKTYSKANEKYLVEVKVKAGSFSVTLPIYHDFFTQYGCIKVNNFYYLYIGRFLYRFNKNGAVKLKKFSTDILCIKEDDGKIWVGLTRDGSLRLNQDMEIDHIPDFLKNLSVTSIEIGYEGAIWFSTLEQGVFYIKSRNVTKLSGHDQLDAAAFRLLKIKDEIYFANKNGIFSYDNLGVRTLKFMPNSIVNDMILLNSTLWIGAAGLPTKISFSDISKTEINKNRLSKINIIPSSSKFVILPDSSLVFSQGDFLAKFSNLFRQLKIDRPFLALDAGCSPTFVFIDKRNKIWVGCNNNLFEYNPHSNKLLIQNNPLWQSGVLSMCNIKDNIYAIVLKEGGIAIMQDDKLLKIISTNNGLLTNSVKSVTSDGKDLWITTTKGVSLVRIENDNFHKLTVRNFGKDYELDNVRIFQILCDDNKVYFATSNGIYILKVDAIDPILPATNLPFYFTSIKTFNYDSVGVSSIEVPFNDRNINIAFDAINFTYGSSIEYYYRFKNQSENWQKINGKELQFQSLSSGNYDLELRAEIPDLQRNSKILSLNILVQKPWYQRKLTIILAVVLGLVLLYLLLRRQAARIQKKEALKREQAIHIMELEHTALRSQMNPHFIFNCLTSIQHLIVSDKNDEANDYLVEFANIVRKSLEYSDTPSISISEEKQYLEDYLSLELLRFTGQFTYEVTVAENIDSKNIFIPPMLLQPIAENAVKHGVTKLVGNKGLIKIHFEKEVNSIKCTITDNGVGRQAQKQLSSIAKGKKSYGLEFVKKRLESEITTQRKQEVFIINDILNADGQIEGTEVILRLPYKNSYS